MKLKGRITLLISNENTYMEIEDDNASVRFLTIRLTNEELVRILSRQGMVECDIELHSLDKLGKKHECKDFVFEIPLRGYSNNLPDKEYAKMAQTLLDKEGEGWIAEDYFRSQNSFFKNGDKQMARCTIRRWI
jgi:hypothetical protein